jgi:hypothetical protein
VKSRLPTGLVLVAVLQFIPPLILPPSTLASLSPLIWAVYLLIFALLGINLVRGRGWARLAMIFVQGFSIIGRLLITMSHAVVGRRPSNPLDWALVGTTLISVTLSALILYYVDRPDIQVRMT